jgi:hypothetical protein
MKNIIVIPLLLIIASVFVMCTNSSKENAQEKTLSMAEEGTTEDQIAEQDTIKGSIPSEATGNIGAANIKVYYYAPGVKSRILWGGLVPYDQVWATGAHMATSVEFDKDLTIGNTEVSAGKYGLFTVPGREEWAVIINKNWEQHLTDDYDQKEDVLRLKVKPTDLKYHQERLKYGINELSETEGTINISWDKLMVVLPLRVK